MSVQDILHTVTAGGALQAVAALPGANQIAVGVIGANGLNITSASANDWFEPGDNILLQNVWANLPFGFCQGELPGGHRITLSWRDNFGNRFGIPELGADIAGDGVLAIPELGCPIAFPPDGLFIKVPTTLSRRYRLSIEDSNLEISMVNLPASLAGVTVTAVYYFQVLHTKQMQSVP